MMPTNTDPAFYDNRALYPVFLSHVNGETTFPVDDVDLCGLMARHRLAAIKIMGKNPEIFAKLVVQANIAEHFFDGMPDVDVIPRYFGVETASEITMPMLTAARISIFGTPVPPEPAPSTPSSQEK